MKSQSDKASMRNTSCSSVFKDEKKRRRFSVYVQKTHQLCKLYWIHHFGFERTETKRDLALLLFPFTDLKLRPDSCIPVELETARSISPQIKAHMTG